MPVPTYADVYEYLEQYGITESILRPAWITKRITNQVIPFVERLTKQSVSGIVSVTEYYSGNGTGILILNRKPIVAVTEVKIVNAIFTTGNVSLTNIEVIAETGLLKAKGIEDDSTLRVAMFPRGTKNIKVTYTYGFTDCPNELHEAILLLACEACLGYVGGATGGGALGGQGFNRNYGARGKWTDQRADMTRQALSLIGKYKTGVSGS